MTQQSHFLTRSYVHRKNCYVSVYSGFILDFQKLKIQMSFTCWMNQEVHWDTYTIAIKRKKLIVCGWISYVLCFVKRSQTQKAASCLVSLTWHSGEGKATRKEDRSAVAGVGGRDELHAEGCMGAFLGW